MTEEEGCFDTTDSCCESGDSLEGTVDTFGEQSFFSCGVEERDERIDELVEDFRVLVVELFACVFVNRVTAVVVDRSQLDLPEADDDDRMEINDLTDAVLETPELMEISLPQGECDCSKAPVKKWKNVF